MSHTGHDMFRLWGATNFRSIQKHPSYKIILGSIPHRRFKASGRDSLKNTN